MTSFKQLHEQLIRELDRNDFKKETSELGQFPVNADYYTYKHFDEEIVFTLKDGSTIAAKYRLERGSQMRVGLWRVMPDNKFLATGYLTLIKKKFGKFKFAVVEHALLKQEFQGLGIVPQTYQALVDSGISLVATSHSIGARGMWFKLSAEPSIVIWSLFGDAFVVDVKNPKKDYVYGIQLATKFQSKKNTKELTQAIIKAADGTIQTRNVYNDDDPANLTSLVMTKRGGTLDLALTKLEAFAGVAELPHKETDDKEIQTLYQAINALLLQK